MWNIMYRRKKITRGRRVKLVPVIQRHQTLKTCNVSKLNFYRNLKCTRYDIFTLGPIICIQRSVHKIQQIVIYNNNFTYFKTQT